MHNKAKYVLNRPEDITGVETVERVEQHTGIEVRDVVYREILPFLESYYEHNFANPGELKNVNMSMT
ncbi:hypothetical protein BDV24DRAFT_124304 [Aspergillus arachidicola]|uniref:Uncharacterized protein n=1 Tax=Aspergillus arachidicola TaxID=656916 RepID=A0A5N6YLM0_9EURO|nr:hypothetical protein BDV24DRAFT_124304 [Aspergillus arachidicola]